MLKDIEFEVMARPDPQELIDFYAKQGRPVTDSAEKIGRMLESTYCCVTARRDGTLVGWARGVTDGLRGRLAECKLDPALQGPGCVTRCDGRIEHDEGGIARDMAYHVIEALRAYGVEEIDVLAYGTEVDFCEELGFKKIGGVVLMSLPVGSAASVSARGSANAAGK